MYMNKKKKTMSESDLNKAAYIPHFWYWPDNKSCESKASESF